MARTNRTSQPERRYAAPSRSIVGGLLLLAVGAGVGAWSLRSPDVSPSRATSVATRETSKRVSAPPPRRVKEATREAIPFMAAGADDSSEHEPKHPHPHTPQHARIYRENNLSGAMRGAMNVGDYAGLRALVQEYRDDYPEDEYRLQEGYGIIADCLEKLTPERQRVAREYWETKRGSTLRRFIRRHCLEKSTVLEESTVAE